MNYDFQDIEGNVKNSLAKLIENDGFLLKENVNERSITYRLAMYLQEEFEGYEVDCEYNRMNNGQSINIKTINYDNNNVPIDDDNAKTVFPDIIVHKRNKPENLLVIEAKKSNNKNLELDQKKLEIFTSLERNFRYFYGLNLIFQVKSDFGKPTILKWYKEGEFDNESKYSL